MPEVQDIVHTHKRNYISGLTKLAKQAGAANPSCWATNLPCSTKAQPRCPPLSTTARPGHTPERPRKHSSTKQSTDDNDHSEVVAADRIASLIAVGVIATTAFCARLDGIQQVATFRAL